MEFEEKDRDEIFVEQQDIDEIKLWMETLPHLPTNIPDDLIKSFLHSNYLNIEMTKRTIEMYYQCKNNSPEFFLKRDMNDPGLQLICDVIDMCILPRKSIHGYVILFARLKDCDPNRFVVEDAIKLLFMMIDTVLVDNPTPSGFIFIFDNEGTTIRHLLKVSLSIIKKYITYLQEGIPVRMKQIHVMNCNFIVTQIMNVLKPFLNGSHEVILHSPDKFKDVFKAVDQDTLPKEYGGKAGCLEDLKRRSYSQIKTNASWYEKDETLRMDESKRIKTEKSFSKFLKSFTFS